MAYQNLVCFFSVFILMRILEVKILAIRGGRLSSFYLHLSSMASQRMNARFNKNFDPFVNLCHVCGHKPTSVLSVSTLVWWWWEYTTEMYEKTLELEEYFQKLPVLRYTWSHIRFGLMGVMRFACDAIDLDMIHTVWVGEIGDKPDLSLLPLSLLTCSGDRQSFRFFLPSFI